MRSVSYRIAAVMLVVLFALALVGCSSTYVRSAKIYLQQDDAENAKRVLQEGTEATPEDAELWYMLGKVNAELKNYDEMNEAFAKAQELSDEYNEEIKKTRYEAWRVTYNAAVTPFNEGNFDKANELLLKALKIKPGDIETLTRLGLSYLQEQKLDEAEKYLTQALEESKDNPQIPTMYNLLLLYWRQQRFEDTILMADQILEAGGEELDMGRRIDVTQKKALSLQQLDRMDEAIAQWEQAIATDSTNADFYYNKAILLHSMERFEDAADAYMKAIELNPEDNEARINAARSLLAGQQWETIVKVLEPMLFPEGEIKVYDPEITQLDPWLMLRAAYTNIEAEDRGDVVAEILVKLQQKEAAKGGSGS